MFLITVDTVGEPGICLNLTCGIAVIANVEKWFEVLVGSTRLNPTDAKGGLGLSGGDSGVELDASVGLGRMFS